MLLLSWQGGSPWSRALPHRPYSLAMSPISGLISVSVKWECWRYFLTLLLFPSDCSFFPGLLGPCFGICAHLVCIFPAGLGSSSSPLALHREMQVALREYECHLTNISAHNKCILIGPILSQRKNTKIEFLTPQQAPKKGFGGARVTEVSQRL